MSYRNFTPSQILNRAIGKEEQARMLYEIYADKVEDRQGKALLKELAAEEAGHKKILEKVDPEQPGTFNTAEISSVEISEFFDKPEISKEATMQEVLRFAIAEEIDAYNFYDSLKAYTADENFLNLLSKLEAEEKKHKDRLEDMYDRMFQPEN